MDGSLTEPTEEMSRLNTEIHQYMKY